MATNKGRSVWDTIDDSSLDDAGEFGPRLPFIKPGKFLLRVRKITHYASTRKKNVEYFKAEFDVLEGNNGGDEAVCWMVTLVTLDSERMEMALRDIRRFTKALLGSEVEINREFMERLTSDEQPAAELPVRCEAVKTDSDFTRCYWSTVEQ